MQAITFNIKLCSVLVDLKCKPHLEKIITKPLIVKMNMNKNYNDKK